MTLRNLLWISGCLIAAITSPLLYAAEEPGLLKFEEEVVPLTPGGAVIPIQNDAHFRDVCLVDSEVGFAVGDQGAIWKTTDGGQTWKWRPTGFSWSLTDVCFLTRKIGWISARGVHPYGQEGWGLVLHTRDGGNTWTRLPQNQLPPLNAVQFFDLDNGVAVGEASPRYPSGVMTTVDGGQTWTAREGESDKNWLTGEFLSSEEGIVAGTHGQIARASSDNFSPVTFSQFDLRSINDVSYSHEGKCWLAGEGASLFCSSNQGLAWTEPPGEFPEGLPLMQDFQSIAQVGTHVWVAGSPGSVIWHSPDEGQTWEPQYTQQSVPIQRITFRTEMHGCAVGALGTILLTRDGGRSWKTVKGEGHHVALMQVAPDREEIDIPLLAQQSAEQGYRSLVFLPWRDDVPRGHYKGTASGQLLSNSAVLSAHGSQAITAWQFPLTKPDLEQDRTGLIRELNRWSDGNMGRVMLESFVVTIRTWRPEVIVLPDPESGDEINKLLQQAFHEAISAAGDPTRFIEHQSTLGLKPWQVKRVFYQSPAGTAGDITVDPYDLLTRKSQTIIEFAASGLYQSGQGKLESIRPIHYQLAPQDGVQQVKHSFFGGIVLAPGSGSRRELDPLNEEALAKAERIARRRKHLAAIGEMALGEQGRDGQMISEMRQSLRGLSARQAAEQLVHLADDYREQGDLEREEQVLVELVNLYPREPITAQAVRRLYHLWSSTEVAWMRSKDAAIHKERGQLDVAEQRRLIEEAEALRGQRGDDAGPLTVKGESDPFERKQQAGDIRIGERQDWRNEKVKLWRSQAIKLASYLQGADEYQFHSPAIQFPLAGLLSDLPPEKQRHFAKAEANNPVALFQLLGANSRPSIVSKKTAEPPLLDGMLSDPCWQDANEIRLETRPRLTSVDDARPILFLAHDDKFLYIAGSFPKVDISYVETTTAGREHDQAAAGFDRLQVAIDLDADYHSAWEFTFDQRGQVSESCFNDERWDPQLYLAVQQDDTHWRLEGAIPFEEISPNPPKSGRHWSICLQRIIPSVGIQSWSYPTDEKLLPSSYGTLTFE